MEVIAAAPVIGDSACDQSTAIFKDSMHFASRSFDAAGDVSEAAHIALARALEIAGTPRGNVQLISWNNGAALHIIAQEGFGEEFLRVFSRVTLDHPSACGRALSLRRTVVVEDVMLDRLFAPYRDVALRAGVRAVQSTPLIASGGSLVGIVSMHADRPHRPSEQQLTKIEGLARAAADAITALRTKARIIESGLTVQRSQADWLDAHGVEARALEDEQPCLG